MKILALVFLFGFAAAISHEDLDRARDEAVLSFMIGMEKAPSLQDAMGMDFAELAEDEDGIKTELVKTLREALDTLVRHIKEAVDHGKTVKEDMKEHLQKIKEQLGKLHEDIGDKARELLERIKEKTVGKLRDWFNKLLKRNKEESEAYAAAEKSKVREILEDIRSKLNDKTADFKKIAQEIRERLKDHAMIANLLLKDFTKETMDKAKALIDRLLGKNNDKETRTIKDLYEKMKDYLKDARDDFKEHYSRFLDWLENVYKSGAEAAKDRIENVKKVALKFIDHVDEVGKKTADEALEFFRPYKKDLGTLWDELKKSIEKAYGKH